MDSSSDFKKMLEEKGIKHAIKTMKDRGMVYSEDFTVQHRNDPIFSNPNKPQSIPPQSRSLSSVKVSHSGVADSVELKIQTNSPRNESSSFEHQSGSSPGESSSFDDAFSSIITSKKASDHYEQIHIPT